MRYMYGAADEKYVRARDKFSQKALFTKTLQHFRFRQHPFLAGKPKYDKKGLSIEFKTEPETLLHLAAKVVDEFKLPSVFKWSNFDVCNWIRKFGYPQYQQTFRANEIIGQKLLLIDASALIAMNIRIFNHVQHIAYGIRSLFHFELTKFGRSIQLPPFDYLDLYKLYRVSTGQQHEATRRTDLWRRMKILRAIKPNYDHWQLLERHVRLIKDADRELFSKVKRHDLFECKCFQLEKSVAKLNIKKKCKCMPPCQCHWSEKELRRPWRFKVLPGLDGNSVLRSTKLHCPNCMPPCTCHWTTNNFTAATVLSVLQDSFPTKYGETRSSAVQSQLRIASKATSFSSFLTAIIQSHSEMPHQKWLRRSH